MGSDAYPDVWTKAAASLQSIVNNHALIDGNKRLGWLATAVFFELNGVDVTNTPNDDVFAMVMSVATSPLGFEDIAARLQAIVS